MIFNPNQAFDLPLLPPDLKEEDLFSPKVMQLVIKANKSISELKGACHALPNAYPLLLNIPVLQEVVSSSAIEGIHTTLETLLEAQIQIQQQNPSTKEALRYREALEAGAKSFKKYESLSTRTILTIHRHLLPQGGRFKQQINKIARGSQTIYTPPSPDKISTLMANWEKYTHSLKDGIDPLIKTAIGHYQFEAIHPFSDGNGRTGRILIVLQMLLYKLLDFPVLYISGYLITNRRKYYTLLLNISKTGRWIEFIIFFLIAFDKQAQETKKVIMNIIKTREDLKRTLKKDYHLIYSRDFLDHIFSYPITNATFMAQKLNITYQTASKHLSELEQNKILKQKKSGTYKLYYNLILLNCLTTK